MRNLPEPMKWILATLIVVLGTVAGLFLGAGADKLAWEIGFTDGDSGMELLGYLILGAILGLIAGVTLAAVLLRRVPTD